MPNFNKVILLGHLTRDPELSSTPSGTSVVNFGLAMNRVWKNSEGQEQKNVCFIECFGFGKIAENINKYTTKGNALLVEGHLDFNLWTAKDGNKRSQHKVCIERFQFLSIHSKKQQPAGSDKPAIDTHPDSRDQDDDIPF